METVIQPNSAEALRGKVTEGIIPKNRIWGMLALRSVLSFGLLLLLALIYQLASNASPFADSAAWWLWFVTLCNGVCIILMIRFGRLEGVRLKGIYQISRSTWKGDLLWFLLAFIGIAVFAMLPGTLLAQWLWGNADYPNGLLIRPLPVAAIYPLIILFPITQALAELPVYWGYVAPRLRAGGLNRWLVILIVGAVLSLQHLFFSFQPDWRYALWLALKFLPFALWTGFVTDRRPGILPYLMFVHFLLDVSLPFLILMKS